MLAIRKKASSKPTCPVISRCGHHPGKSILRCAEFGSALWLIAMVPMFVVAIILVIPVVVVSKLTGWGATAKRTQKDVLRTIEQFLDGGGGPYDWDDFTSVPDADPHLEAVRLECVRVAREYPPDGPREWCAPTGLEELRRIARELREADG